MMARENRRVNRYFVGIRPSRRTRLCSIFRISRKVLNGMNGRLFPIEACCGQKRGQNSWLESKPSTRIKLFLTCRHFSTADVAKTAQRVATNASIRSDKSENVLGNRQSGTILLIAELRGSNEALSCPERQRVAADETNPESNTHRPHQN